MIRYIEKRIGVVTDDSRQSSGLSCCLTGRISQGFFLQRFHSALVTKYRSMIDNVDDRLCSKA